MKTLTTTWIALLALLALVAAAPARAVSALELAVVVHASTPVTTMSAMEMERVFTRNQTRWDDGTPTVPLNAAPSSEARIVFDKAVLRLNPDDIGKFWIDRRIRGLGLPPRHVADPATIVRVVQKLPGAISYVPEPLAQQAGLKVVARIQHGRVLPP